MCQPAAPQWQDPSNNMISILTYSLHHDAKRSWMNMNQLDYSFTKKVSEMLFLMLRIRNPIHIRRWSMSSNRAFLLKMSEAMSMTQPKVSSTDKNMELIFVPKPRSGAIQIYSKSLLEYRRKQEACWSARSESPTRPRWLRCAVRISG